MKPELNHIVTKLHQLQDELYDAMEAVEEIKTTPSTAEAWVKVLKAIELADGLASEILDSGVWD